VSSQVFFYSLWQLERRLCKMKKAIFLFMMSVIFLALTSCKKILETGFKKQMNQSRADMLKDGNLHVVSVPRECRVIPESPNRYGRN
jgi:hypothetical protein